MRDAAANIGIHPFGVAAATAVATMSALATAKTAPVVEAEVILCGTRDL